MRGITRGLTPSPTTGHVAAPTPAEATAPSPAEAAAAIAAVEQFIRDTLPAADAPAAPSPWLVAALHEGVEREVDRHPW